MSHIPLDYWHSFAAVVKHQGYAQAARHLHKSQSSVSYAVAQLQGRLGVRLFEPSGRKSVLTESGQALYQRCQLLLQHAADLEDHASQLAQGWEAEVRLVVDTAFPTDCLMAALAGFERLKRATQIKLSEVVLSGADEALHSGKADIVITTHPPSAHLCSRLLDIEFIAVAHPEHPLQQHTHPLQQNDLRRHRQIVVSDSGPEQRDAGWLGSEQRWSVSSFETSIEILEQGLGYAWLPAHRIRQSLQEGRLQPLNLYSGGRQQTDLYLLVVESSATQTGTMALTDILRTEASKWQQKYRQAQPQMPEVHGDN